MKDVTVFYAGMVYGEYSHSEWEYEWVRMSPEVYNGGWIHTLTRQMSGRYGPDPGWYRADGTPVLLPDVPPELQLLNLLLT